MKTALICLLTFACSAIAADNVVRNGDFEKDSDWGFMANNGARCSGEYDSSEHHGGQRSYRLSNASGFAPHVYGRVFQSIQGLMPYTTYRISCFVKGKNVGIAWIGGGPGWGLRKRIPEGTFDWQEVSTEYATDGSPPDFDLMILLESQCEAVWIDDVKMEAIKVDREKQALALRSITVRLEEQNAHLQRVQQLLKKNSGAANDRYVQMGVAIARRFLDRVTNGSSMGRQSMGWSNLQLEEIGQVLDETERLITKSQGAPIPWPTGAGAPIRDGIFHTHANTGYKVGNDVIATDYPFFFAGYGHFGSVERDLPNFKTLGASLIQDGRCGPSAMNADGSLRANALATIATLDKAAANHVKVDFLLSPHYFPDWARTQSPDVASPNGGFINFNIDHPDARAVIARWIHTIGAAMKDKPALFSVCLSNEPVYHESGRNSQSRISFTKWLKIFHGDIAALNQLYGTSYKSFEEVPVPGIGLPEKLEARRAYYDWCRFNHANFVQWHSWMRKLVRQELPEVPCHAKIMVFFAFDRDKLHFGVDPELFCDAMDIAGCDAYAFPESPTTYGWHGHEFFYDLLHSFRGQPVFNSENHIIPDGYAQAHIPAAHTRAVLWQGALHHQGATTIWVWEEPSDSSLMGSIYLRPGNVFGAGRAMLDLARFSNEVAAINQARPRVALLYSWPSIFWEENYRGTIMSIYTMLNFLGEPVTFVSEQQLEEERAAAVDWIIVPKATHVSEAAVKALERFQNVGGPVLFIGDDNLAYDEYHRKRALSPGWAGVPRLYPQASEQDTSRLLHDTLVNAGGLDLTDLTDATGKHTWGVEYRAVPYQRHLLMPIINLSGQPQTVHFPSGFPGPTDLLTGEKHKPGNLQAEPMVPYLLQFDLAK